MASIEHTNSPAPGYTPEAVPTTAPAASDEEIRAIVSAFEAHDFGSDDEFRAGMPAIMKSVRGRGSNAADIDAVIARAQWFYFTTRLKQSSVPFETYLRHRTRETESQPMKSPVAGATKLSAASAPAPTATLAPPSASVAPAAPAPAAPAPAPAVSAAETRAAETVAVTGESAAASAAPAPTGTSTEDMKFGDIVRLIAEGRASEVPVPTIPDGINEAPPSVSSLAARPKPWEKAATAATEGSTETPATATDTVQ